MSIEAILNKALSQKPQYKYVPEFHPTHGNIRALTLEGEPFDEKRTKIFAYYGVPEQIKGKVPAMVLIHGGGGHAFHCWVKQWNDRGYAAIAIDTTGFLPKTVNAGAHEGDGENWERELNGVFYEEGYVCAPDNDGMRLSGKQIEEHWMLHAVSAAIRANSFLREQPEIDNQKIGVTGVSWGAVITSILIGYDTRFRFAVPIYGSGYLSESLSDIMQVFKTAEVKKLWLAETRFDEVKIPVLWLAWNDDCCFSIPSNSKSYQHTRGNHEKTRLSLIHLLMHGHNPAWQREEPFYFADWVVNNGSMMPDITDQSAGDRILLQITADEDVRIESATLYYICEPMRYEVIEKYETTQRTFMVGQWNTLPLTLDGNTAKGVLPQDAVGYYHEIVFVCNGKRMVVTTGYKED